jgi:hypothetical protein
LRKNEHILTYENANLSQLVRLKQQQQQAIKPISTPIPPSFPGNKWYFLLYSKHCFKGEVKHEKRNHLGQVLSPSIPLNKSQNQGIF